MAPLHYRTEIDGARAIAVVLVVLYHLGVTPLRGGFTGVDVFFVISGYLITGIILKDVQSGSFSLKRFFERRIRRVIPALLTVSIACIGAGYLVLSPGDYLTLARSALYGLVGASNVFFFLNTGYFDVAAEMLPLLHTWSLGVEEQFYLVWPMFLVVACRVAGGRGKPLFALLAVAAAFSFLASVTTVAADPKAAFYLPHTRAWEFAAGGVLTLLPPLRAGIGSRLVAEALPMTGLTAILWGAFTLDQQDPFPGYNALWPVGGAVLFLYRAGLPSLTYRLLSLPPVVFVGKISYSLYLWHWPLVAFWRHYLNGAPLTPTHAVVIAIAAVMLSWISWKWIEEPCRRPHFRWRTVLGPAFAVAAVAAVTVVSTSGVAARIPPGLQALSSGEVMWEWPCPQSVSIGVDPLRPTCVVGAPWSGAMRRAVIWGESHAEHLLPLLDVAGREQGTAVALLRECPAFVRPDGVRRHWPEQPEYNDTCGESRQRIVEWLKASTDVEIVLLAAAWSYLPEVLYRHEGDAMSVETGLALLEDGLDAVLRDIAGEGRNVFIIADVPHWTADPVSCVIARETPLLRAPCARDVQSIPRSAFDQAQKPTHDVLRAVVAGHRGTSTYSPEDYLCDATACMAYLGNEFLYRDVNHIRRNLSPPTLRQLTTIMRFAELLAPPDSASRRPVTGAMP